MTVELVFLKATLDQLELSILQVTAQIFGVARTHRVTRTILRRRVMRFISGVQVRQATGNVAFHDKTIRAGDRVFLMLSAANRDPRVYTDADTLSIERERIAHLSFGWGPHLCLGFPLARIEGQEALPRVLATWPSITRADDQALPYLDSVVFRGVESLPLTLT